MIRSLIALGLSLLIGGGIGLLASCQQPVSGGALANEAFDTNRPTTPSVTPASAPLTHEFGRGTVHFFHTPPLLNFSVTPGSPARYRIDGGSWVGPSATLTEFDAAGLIDGSYLLELQERDPAGNWSEPFSYSFVIDSLQPAPPTFSPSTPATTSSATPRFFWYGDAVDGARRFSGEISGPGVSLQALPVYNFSSLPPGSEFTVAPVTFTGTGTVTISLWEYDYAGNVSPTATYAIDIVPGVLAHWFATSSPTSDSSGSGHALSVNGAINQVAPTQVAGDYVDLSASFDAGYYVPTPNTLSAGTQGQTIAFWILGNDLGTEQGAILTRLRDDGAPTPSPFAIGTKPSTGLLRLAINNYAQLSADLSTSALSAGFNQVVYVFNYTATTVSVYVNGAALASDVAVAGGDFYAEMSDPGAFYIGHRPGSTLSDRAAQVQIDDVQLFDAALSASDVSALYTLGRQ